MKVATGPNAVLGVGWPDWNFSYSPPVSGVGQVVAGQIAARGYALEWSNADTLQPTDQTYSDTPNPTSPSSNWWPVSTIPFTAGTPVGTSTGTATGTSTGTSTGTATGTIQMFNPTKVTWVDPTLNTDGTPIAGAAGEVITGYEVGIRLAGGAAGAYPILMPVVGPTTVSELFSSLPTVLAPAGSATVNGYYVAVRTKSTFNGAESDSAWSVEVVFSVMIVTKVPQAPTAFTLA